MSKSKREEPKVPTREEMDAIISKAVEEGRHGEVGSWRTVCNGCSQWVDSIWHVNPPDRKRYCRKCAEEKGFV